MYGLGIGWSWFVAVPGLMALAYTLTLMKNIPLPVSRGQQRWSDLRPYAKPLGLLYAVVVLRTVTSQSLSTFLPVVLTRQGMSVPEASAAVTMYLFWSGIGGFFGGPLADRYGPRTVIIASLLLSVPFFVAAHWTSGWAFTAFVSIGAFLLQSTLPVNVTFGQQLAPVSAATVASLMMGFGWGSGALLAPFVGFLGDTMGLTAALLITAIIPIAAAAVALPLPNRAPASARTESQASYGETSLERPEV
jgi:FSR family fosmidomycin resistance protein-like MFS transporter